MLDDLSWTSLQQHRQLSKVTLMYRIVHHLIAVPASPYLIQYTHYQLRGHNMRYAIPRSNTLIHKASFFPKRYQTMEYTSI